MTFINWHLNLLFLSMHWFIYYLMHKDLFIEIFWSFIIDFLIIFFMDIKLRAFWLMLYENKQYISILDETLNNMTFPFFLIDQKTQVLSSNELAKKILQNLDKNNKNALFSSLLQKKDRESFANELIESKFVQEHNYFKCGIHISHQIMKELLPEIRYEEDLKNFFNTLKLKKQETTKIMTLEEPLNDKNSLKTEEIQYNIQITPLMIGKKLSYFLSLRNNNEFYDYMTKMKYFLLQLHFKSQEILYKMEQDYIKWNNMQGLSVIKESDLKNLGLLIFDVNFQLAQKFITYEILQSSSSCTKNEELDAKTFKDFNMFSLLTYIMEVISIKAMTMNHEITLFIEESFPDYVSGRYFLFKYTILIILNLMINEWDFPKHSKFKMSCQMKEYMSIGNDNHFGLRFEFHYPNNHDFTNYIKRLITEEYLQNPLVFITSQRIKSNKNYMIFLQGLLKALEGNIIYKEDSDIAINHCFVLDVTFKTVDLATIISSPNRSFTRAHNTSSIMRNNATKKIHISNINLSFSKVLLKKNIFIWKNKPPAAATALIKSKNAAVLNSLQKNIEINENFKRKISVRSKEDSPLHHKFIQNGLNEEKFLSNELKTNDLEIKIERKTSKTDVIKQESLDNIQDSKAIQLSPREIKGILINF